MRCAERREQALLLALAFLVFTFAFVQCTDVDVEGKSGRRSPSRRRGRRSHRCHQGGPATPGRGRGRALTVVLGSIAGAGLRGPTGKAAASGLATEAETAKAEEAVAVEVAVEASERLVSALAGSKVIMAALEVETMASLVLLALAVAVKVAKLLDLAASVGVGVTMAKLAMAAMQLEIMVSPAASFTVGGGRRPRTVAATTEAAPSLSCCWQS
jgi:hypothetical protein